ncbi:MAG: hypothetical protein JO345_22180 [Streptosporangiaceae bacterium]|nr:hypothetical protein [Streptosporangiaceae bacterium]
MSDGPGMVTILRSRYGGTYEPGEWIAFACWPDDIPPGWNADDLACAEFFASRTREIGGGATPQEAYADLLRLLSERRRSPGSLRSAITGVERTRSERRIARWADEGLGSVYARRSCARPAVHGTQPASGALVLAF